MLQSLDQLVADRIVNLAEIDSTEPIDSPGPERTFVRRVQVVPRQQPSELLFDFGLTMRQTTTLTSRLAEHLIMVRGNVRQRDLVDSQKLSEQHGIEAIGLGPTLHHRAQPKRMRQQHDTDLCEQLVQPPISARGLDHAAKWLELFAVTRDLSRLRAVKPSRWTDFSRVVDRRNHHRVSMQIDAEVPHGQTPFRRA